MKAAVVFTFIACGLLLCTATSVAENGDTSWDYFLLVLEYVGYE